MGARADADRGVKEATQEELRQYINQKLLPGKFDWVPKAFEIVLSSPKDFDPILIGTSEPVDLSIDMAVTPGVRTRCVIVGNFRFKTITAQAAGTIQVSCTPNPLPIGGSSVEAKYVVKAVDNFQSVVGIYHFILPPGVKYSFSMSAAKNGPLGAGQAEFFSDGSGAFMMTFPELA